LTRDHWLFKAIILIVGVFSLQRGAYFNIVANKELHARTAATPIAYPLPLQLNTALTTHWRTSAHKSKCWSVVWGI